MMQLFGKKKKQKIIRLTVLLFLILFGMLLRPLCVRAEGEETVVRVGWFESSFNHKDEYGRRSGYAYEYEQKVAAYTGWKYEYVEGSWSELLEMLKKGEIDLLADVSFTEERAKEILYSSLPMGEEMYYIFARNGDPSVSESDFSTLNGKKVGVNKNSIQESFFLSWAEKLGVQAEVEELSVTAKEGFSRLENRELDAYVTLDSYGDPEKVKGIAKVGASEFYFALNRNRPELQEKLDLAMNYIQDEDLYYNQKLYEKYLQGSVSGKHLNDEEKQWLSGHGKIRVGYQDNYLAFCASDENGELTGALKDYLSYASQVMSDAGIIFEPVAYPTAAAALDAVKSGEVDCMFPANLSDYDGETMGLVSTPPLMRTQMDAVVRASDQKEFLRKEKVVVAVNEGNPNYELFLQDHFPGWEIRHYPDTPAGLEGVSAGEADCVIISNYRFSNIARQCEKLRLTTVFTGGDLDYSFTLCRGDTELYSILAKLTAAVPDSIINAALTYYSTEDAKVDFLDVLKDNILIVLAVVILVALVIIFLLLRSIRAEKKASEEHHLVTDLNRRVFVDALTSVRNKGAFTNSVQKLQDRLDQGEELKFAVGMFDCDDLKLVNDNFGHEKGDIYLKNACRLICRVFQHSPVFRIGGDEFAAVLQSEDLENMEELVKQFYRGSREKTAAAENKWEEVHISMGIAVYDPETDRSVTDTVDRADKIMYENKRVGKRHRR